MRNANNARGWTWTHRLASSSNLISSTCSFLAFFALAIYDAPSVKRSTLDFCRDIFKTLQ